MEDKTRPHFATHFGARKDDVLRSQTIIDGIGAIPDMLVAARIARGMTQKDLAEFMGLKMQQIQAYEADCYQSASLSRIAWVAKALGIKVSLSGELAGKHAMSDIEVEEFEAFPVGEMYRRGWLGPKEGGVKDIQRSSKRLLKAFFDAPFVVGRRRYARTKDRPHEAALIAWETQILRSVNSEPGLPRFDRERVDANWLRNLVRLSGKRNGLRQIRQHLAAIGFILRIEPVLPGMSVDAAIVRAPNRTMVVALTFRKRREEEFWSALLHTIAHARLHVSLGEWDTVFHENEAPAHEPWLADADVFAREALIPMSAWATWGRLREGAESYAKLAQIAGARSYLLLPSTVAPERRRLSSIRRWLRILKVSGPTRRYSMKPRERQNRSAASFASSTANRISVAPLAAAQLSTVE